MKPPNEEVTLKYSILSNFNPVVQLDFSCCGYLLSDHLEQRAIACPNLL